MNEYRIVWQACPHVNHPQRVMFVEALSDYDAEAIAQDHIERHHGVAWFTIHSVELYHRPTGGRVLEGS